MTAARSIHVGYCTNVHAGTDLSRILRNLDEYAAPVRATLAADPATAAWAEPMGIGLWLPASAARDLRDPPTLERFRDALAERRLHPFTCNAFPYDDFHRRTVKHQVYVPAWDDTRRLAATRDVVSAMARLQAPFLPEARASDATTAGSPPEASVSTLPLGWRGVGGPGGPGGPGGVDRARAAEFLRKLALHAAGEADDTGVVVHLDLEPEPGCELDRAVDVVRFFEDHVLAGRSAAEEARLRRHLRVCHDICHASVMFEGQTEAFETYARAGIAVGKVQVSNAVAVDFDAMEPDAIATVLAELEAYREPRYLHQVTRATRTDGPVLMTDDLPDALERVGGDPAAVRGERWRVHFHVPLTAADLGTIGTTQDAVDPCLVAARAAGVTHFEAETYAWTVLPPERRPERLEDGIAAELRWLLGRPALARTAPGGSPASAGAAS